MKKNLSDGITEGVILAVLILFALSTLYPFVYFLACSFNTASDTMRGGFIVFPRCFTLDNYKAAFQNAGIPAIDLIDFEYGPDNIYWHTAGDTVDKLSADSLGISAAIALKMVWKLTGMEP